MIKTGLFQNSPLGSSKPNDSASSPKGGTKLSAAEMFPTDHNWLTNINNKLTQTPNGNSPDQTKESFWVKLPADKSAGKIRDNLLRDNFGFDREDIAEYDRQTDNRGFYLSDPAHEDRAATVNEVKTWNIKNGYVEIKVTGDQAADLRNFRLGRVADKSLAGISDPFLREAVKKDLMRTITNSGQERVNAAERLLNLEVENHTDAAIVRNSVGTLADQPEAQNNAVLQITAAKVKFADAARNINQLNQLYRIDAERSGTIFDKLKTPDVLNELPDVSKIIMPEVRDTPEMQTLRHKISDYGYDVEKAARSAGGYDKKTDLRSANIKVNRAEAAWVNRQAADIFRGLGKADKAAEREMLVRFYTVDDAERKSLELRGSAANGFTGNRPLSIYRKGEYAMSAPEGEKATLPPPPAAPDKELGEEPFKLETKQYEKKYRRVETLWRNGKPTTDVQQGVVRGYERNFQVEGSVKVEGTETTKQVISEDKRGNQVRREIYTTSPLQSPELNPKGAGNASVGAAAAALPDEWNKWMMFRVNSLAATERIRAMDKAQLESHIKNNYQVPPKPESLPKVKIEMERLLGKTKAWQMMKFIEEASYAYWNQK